MDEGAIREVLGASASFGALAPDLFERVIALARLRRVRAGEPLYAAGERARAFFVVRSGGVRLYRWTSEGREQLVRHVGAGGSFAEAAALETGVYAAHAEASSDDTEVVEIGAAAFLALLESDPRLARTMIAARSRELLALATKIEELSLGSAEARLAHHLLRLPALRESTRVRVDLPIAKRDVAAALSITPETLSRILRRWRDAGFVEIVGRTVTILDVHALEAAERGLPRAAGEHAPPRAT